MKNKCTQRRLAFDPFNLKNVFTSAPLKIHSYFFENLPKAAMFMKRKRIFSINSYFLKDLLKQRLIAITFTDLYSNCFRHMVLFEKKQN